LIEEDELFLRRDSVKIESVGCEMSSVCFV